MNLGGCWALEDSEWTPALYDDDEEPSGTKKMESNMAATDIARHATVQTNFDLSLSALRS